MYNKLSFTGLDITDSNLFDDISYIHEINSETDLCVGTTGCAELTFTSDLIDSTYVNSTFTYYVKLGYEQTWRQLGIFTIKEITKANNRGHYKAVAYDNVIKFDVNIDTWLSGITFPITVGNLFSSLCTNCGVTAQSTTFTNSTHQVLSFSTTNVTGRTILSQIASCAGGFAVCRADGKVEIRSYSGTRTSFALSEMKSLDLAEYTAPVINKVWVGVEEDDVGTTYGSGSNLLRITNNALLYTDSDITTEVQNIYNVVNAISYTPFNANCFTDKSVNVGDLVSINGTNSIVMRKEIGKSGVILESTGNQSRSADTTTAQSSIMGGSYKYNKLKVDIDGIETEIGNARGSQTSLVARLQEIEGKITSSVKTYRQDTVPSNPQSGDLWFVTAVPTGTSYIKEIWYRYSGSAWEKVQENQVNTATTSAITIAKGEVTSEVSANYVKNDTTSATQTCKWKLDSSSWTVSINGTDKFKVNSNGAYVNGVVDATSGTLGDLNVTGAISVYDDSNTLMCQMSKIGSGAGFVFRAGSGSWVPLSVYRMSNGIPTIANLQLNQTDTTYYGRNYVYHQWWGVTGGFRDSSTDAQYNYNLFWYNLYNTNNSWSDRDKKKDIEDLDDRYSNLFDRLRPVRFKYKAGTSNRYHTGFIAQEINDARDASNLTANDLAATLKLPDETTAEKPEEWEKRWALRTDELVALCVKEIQSLKARVAELEEQLQER